MEKMPVYVVLDNVRSGLNVGAIFRTCDAFAVKAIWLCGITARPPHPEILKTALGATESVDWQYFETTEEAIRNLKSMDVSITAIEQTTVSVKLQDVTFFTTGQHAFIFGNEMRGVSEDVLARCDGSIEIPQEGIKHSLNVATSAGIVLWETYRQYYFLRLGS